MPELSVIFNPVLILTCWSPLFIFIYSLGEIFCYCGEPWPFKKNYETN